jgi:hypothetical protein
MAVHLRSWLLVFLILGAPSANARQLVKQCAAMEVRFLKVSLKLVRDIPLNVQQETIEIRDTGTQPRHITVVARGPILGSMDSEQLNPRVTCTKDGLVLAATITRSDNYHGAALQNQLWFPQITMEVVPLTSPIVFQTIWKMRLTNGKVVERSRTPPYPEKRYPITISKRWIRTGKRQASAKKAPKPNLIDESAVRRAM